MRLVYPAIIHRDAGTERVRTATADRRRHPVAGWPGLSR